MGLVTDSDSGTDTNEDKPISDLSSSIDDSSDSDDNPNEVIWAKAARGVWGMAHVFDGKLYFTRDLMQGNFIPKNLKLPEPKPAPEPQAKASSSGEHVQLFRMVYDRKKGFQSEHLYVSRASLLVRTGYEPENSCLKHFLVFQCLWERGRRLRCTHTMHSLSVCR